MKILAEGQRGKGAGGKRSRQGDKETGGQGEKESCRGVIHHAQPNKINRWFSFPLSSFLFPLLSALSLAVPSPALTHAGAGAQATVRLEVRPIKGFVVQNRSEVWLVNPFDGSQLKQGLKGKPWANEPELYLEKVEPLEWKFAVPRNAKAGEYPLELGGVAYVCETTVGVCLRQEVSGKAVLKVGGKGKDVVGVLEVGEVLQLGQP